MNRREQTQAPLITLNTVAVVATLLLALALARPAGPTTIHARDIRIHQEAHVTVK